mmetsp:Transcript_16209/g.23982  ORF Transcript_16209/g.23982 Transcript_16209/m.23982 type:complete len:91 (+) Transcript_16209:1024-1296(+)
MHEHWWKARDEWLEIEPIFKHGDQPGLPWSKNERCRRTSNNGEPSHVVRVVISACVYCHVLNWVRTILCTKAAKLGMETARTTDCCAWVD